MKVIAIETSCDETAVSIVGYPSDADRQQVYASLVSSQEDIHAQFGGVIPELASRRHIEVLPHLVEECLKQAATSLDEIQAVCVTHCPGLMGALLVGLSFAKALAYSLEIPLIGVNHLAGHLAAILLDGEPPRWPHLGLIVSGGHTRLYLGEKRGGYRLLADTRDDAAGEAFDKVAKLLNLGYPGGPEVEKLAYRHKPKGRASMLLPRPRLKDGAYGFSFSGLKTAVAQYVRKQDSFDRSQLAYTFQESVSDILLEQVQRAALEYRPKELIFCGGVSANRFLRDRFEKRCHELGLSLRVPDFQWCTDNAAMIGAVGLLKLREGLTDSIQLAAFPQSHHDENEACGDFFPGAQ